MTGETENLILELLRKMRTEQQAMALDLLDIKARMTSLEEGQASIRGDIVNLYTVYANQSRRIDRIDERLSRIERRLELVEEPRA